MGGLGRLPFLLRPEALDLALSQPPLLVGLVAVHTNLRY
jgi:hypothetical protein